MTELPLIYFKNKKIRPSLKAERIATVPSLTDRHQIKRNPLTMRVSQQIFLKQATSKVVAPSNFKKESQQFCQKEGKLLVKEKIWLIRKIGDILSEDTSKIDKRRKKMRRQVSQKYKKLQRQADMLLNMINEQGNRADLRDVKKLRQTLK